MQFGSFILLFLGGTHVVLLILAIIVLDIGTQFGQVANQTRVQKFGRRSQTIVTIPSLCFSISSVVHWVH